MHISRVNRSKNVMRRKLCAFKCGKSVTRKGEQITNQEEQRFKEAIRVITNAYNSR